MTQTSLHTTGPNLQAMPLATLFSSRLLLTERSSASGNGSVLAETTETLTIRAASRSPDSMDTRGYSHFGINE